MCVPCLFCKWCRTTALLDNKPATIYQRSWQRWAVDWVWLAPKWAFGKRWSFHWTFNGWSVRSWFSVHVAWKGRTRTNWQKVLEADALPSKWSKSADVCLKAFLRRWEVCGAGWGSWTYRRAPHAQMVSPTFMCLVVPVPATGDHCVPSALWHGVSQTSYGKLDTYLDLSCCAS